jgi:NAD(P)-dependent dehydrogenase (short-subunit alcohol dehydrogenase family)
MALAEPTRTLGVLRGMVHTAGLTLTMATWQCIIQVDLIGTAQLLHAFLPLAQQNSIRHTIPAMASIPTMRAID